MGKVIPFWVSDYIGLPFETHGRSRKGCDCWGLVRLVLEERFGQRLPCYGDMYDSTKAAAQIGRIVDLEKRFWQEIPAGKEKLGDVIVLRARGQPMHVGLVIGGGKMLHVVEGADSVFEPYDGFKWKNRVTGFYRYDDGAGNGG